MSLRQCCEICCAPNTVSRFVRVFPKAALFFLILHIVIMIITVASFVNRKDAKPAVTVKPVLPEDDLGFVKLPRPALPAEDEQRMKSKGKENRVDVVRLVDD